MCDSFAVLPSHSADGSLFFGKSADCEVNEAHHLVRIPRRRHAPGSAVRATHLVIPQAEQTWEMVLSKSYWTYGAEIGMNEFGLAIANEAVHPVIPAETRDGLITMDLLRLGLERGRNCVEAIEVMTSLLKQFGQSGNCEVRGNSHFDGSYILSDQKEAWILETAGREFAARPIKGAESISNLYSIRDDWKICSLSRGRRVDWAAAMEDQVRLPKTTACHRLANSSGFLKEGKVPFTLRSSFDLLRLHGEEIYPMEGKAYGNICFHPGTTGKGESQTTGAMVVQYAPEGILGWATGTSATCISVFKPVFPGIELPDVGPAPTINFDERCLWWSHELLYRHLIFDFENRFQEIRQDCEKLEERFMRDAQTLIRSGSETEKRNFMEDCFEDARQLTRQWIERVKDVPIVYPEDPYGEMWQRNNRQACMPF